MDQRIWGIFMATLQLLELLSVTAGRTVFPGPTSGIREYCQLKPFEAACDDGHVVVVTRAKYGRMKLGGRCVKGNYGYLGCSVDVLTVLDRRCSGLPTCKFLVGFDPVAEEAALTLQGSSPCPEDISSYLEIEYTCVRVERSQGIMAGEVSDVFPRSAQGFLVPINHPLTYQIQAKTGQHVNLTIYNFGRGLSSYGNDDNFCQRVAMVTESESQRPLSICSNDPRETHVLQSRGARVTLTLESRSDPEMGRFLMKYEIVGCPQLVPPKNSYVTVKNNMATITCNFTKESWQMQCRGGSWVGERANCTTRSPLLTNKAGKQVIFPVGILVVVAIGVALGVFLGGLLLTAIVLYLRSCRKRKPTAASNLELSEQQQSTLRSATLHHTIERIPNREEKNRTIYEGLPDMLSAREAIHNFQTFSRVTEINKPEERYTIEYCAECSPRHQPVIGTRALGPAMQNTPTADYEG